MFLSWLGDPFDGAEQMVRDTKDHATVGCLSNTNALHWREHDLALAADWTCSSTASSHSSSAP